MSHTHRRFLISVALAGLFPIMAAFSIAALGGAHAAQPGPDQVKIEPLAGNLDDEVRLTSHRAVYELTLSKSVGSKSPTAAHGRIAFDFAGSPCEGYVQNLRQLTELQPAEGPTRVSDMHSATFEDPDGKTFDFKMQTRVDSGAPESIDGRAVKSGKGPVLVNLAKPKRSRLELGDDVAFPTEHLKRIVAAAETGKNLIEVKVFDGSDTGEKVFETTTYIGRPITTPAPEKAAQIPELANMTRWPVSISYFEAGKKDESPSYVLSFDLYRNGISRALKLDYGDFVLSGELSSLEVLNEPACQK